MNEFTRNQKIALLGKKLRDLEQAKSMLHFNVEKSAFKSGLEEKIKHEILLTLMELDSLLVKSI